MDYQASDIRDLVEQALTTEQLKNWRCTNER